MPFEGYQLYLLLSPKTKIRAARGDRWSSERECHIVYSKL